MRKLATIVLSSLLLSMLGAAFAAAPAAALPTPGLNCQITGTPLANNLRYVPEADQTNDFVGYFEAKQCFQALNTAYPDRMEVKVVGKSYGHVNAQTMQRDRQDIYLIEVTNEKSEIPFDEKVKVALMLSIHGNEKGGREGGFRVLEDLVRNQGIARQPATGHAGKTLYDLMDYAVLLLLFPNVDGWVKDEPQYYPTAPGTFYERTNAHGADLNRQLPTRGWMLANSGTRKTMNEPEPQGYAPALMNYTNIAYAADIHGMLNPADGCAFGRCTFTENAAPTGENIYGHYVLGLISAGQLTPQEMLRSTRLANLLTERLNNDPTFVAWHSLPSTSVWGGEFYSWSTVWDTIGYTDSGISGDWFLQDTGLNAPGMDFEMAYNHITFDSAYPGAAQLNNVYHVQTVRQIARAYLEAAVTDVQTSIESHGRTTGYLYNPKVFTSAQDKPLDGWALENAHDDLWDYAHVPYQAAPVEYFREMRPYMIDGEVPAVFDEVRANEISAQRLANYDNFIVAGSAIELVKDKKALVDTLKAYVEGGGNLVLTDQSLELMVALGVVPEGSVNVIGRYAGMTLMQNRAHDLAKHAVKLSRQTFEPVPIGFNLQNSAPNWFVNYTAFKSAGGEIVGVVPKTGSVGGASANPLAQSQSQLEVNLGRIKLGSGSINFLGGLLPDPTQEFYHPYGLESYATTYFGNLLLYNMLGAEQVFTQPPIVLENVGQLRQKTEPVREPPASEAPGDVAGGTPGFEAVIVLLAVLAVALVGLRRRRA